jgi:hypothetical protein
MLLSRGLIERDERKVERRTVCARTRERVMERLRNLARSGGPAECDDVGCARAEEQTGGRRIQGR